MTQPVRNCFSKPHAIAGILLAGLLWAQLLSAQQLAAGLAQSYFLDQRHKLWSWGENMDGQLGNGDFDGVVNDYEFQAQSEMQKVARVRRINMVASGWSHGLALDRGGRIWAWGRADSGQLGLGFLAPDPQTLRWVLRQPSRIEAVRNVVAVAAGAAHSLALRRDGSLWAWGLNNFGQLGLGDQKNKWLPIYNPSVSNAKGIACGMTHSLAVDDQGVVWGWGRNEAHEISAQADGMIKLPVRVAGIPSMQAVSAGDAFSLGLARDGTVWAWGDNHLGQLGSDSGSSGPLPVQGIVGATAIASGGAFGMALLDDGHVITWGDNRSGQLGRGITGGALPSGNALVPPTIAGIAAGHDHALAITADGDLWVWGSNAHEQLGTLNIPPIDHVSLPSPMLQVRR